MQIMELLLTSICCSQASVAILDKPALIPLCLLSQMQQKRGVLNMVLGRTGCLLQLSNLASPGSFCDATFQLLTSSSSGAVAR